jgi:RNA polymerase-binding transcription factor DksA
LTRRLGILGPIMTYDPGPDEVAMAQAAAELDSVEATLGRLDDGTFERCQVCGAPIGGDRLRQDPLLTRCPAHS